MPTPPATGSSDDAGNTINHGCHFGSSDPARCHRCDHEAAVASASPTDIGAEWAIYEFSLLVVQPVPPSPPPPSPLGRCTSPFLRTVSMGHPLEILTVALLLTAVAARLDKVDRICRWSVQIGVPVQIHLAAHIDRCDPDGTVVNGGQASNGARVSESNR